MSKRYHLSEVTKDLVAVAMGAKKAELVIKNATLVNVNTAELIHGTDVAVTKGRIALVGDASHTIGEFTKVIDATGLYLCPGFMDGHMHVESSMMPVRGYARAVIPHGTTAIFADPHEIGNVFGTKGVQFMMEDGRDIPLRFYVALPSCVPAVAAFEDSGAEITPSEIGELLNDDMVCGLGEMMNFPGVLRCDENIHEELRLTLEKNKTITGHYSIPENGKGLNAYIASGARCCHETVRKEDAIAKMRLGMYVQVREGSAWRDLTEVIRSVTETRLDTHYVTLVSDDTHPHTLITDGHLDHIVRRAISEGVNPITAIQMVTINVAQCFHMDRDLGSVSPGRFADFLLLEDLPRVAVKKVFINGELVSENGKLTVEIEKVEYPEWVKNSVHLKSPLTADDFKIAANSTLEILNAQVIEIIEARVGTYRRVFEIKNEDGFVNCDIARDILKVAVIERHHKTGSMGKGFVTGFGLKFGAVASTVAHDAHNINIVGTNDSDMAFAANELVKIGGGMIAVKDGVILAALPLPIAGIMSEESAEDIAAKVSKLDDSFKQLGCNLVSPFMTMALIPLGVLPELRLTNRGLIDTVNFKFTELFI